MRTVKIIALTLLLGACTAQGAAYKAAVVQAATKTADLLLADAEFIMCRGASVGAIRRRYWTSDDRASAWRTLCSQAIPDGVGE